MTEMIDLLRTKLQVVKGELEALQRQRDEIDRRIADLTGLYGATQEVLKHELKDEGLSGDTEASWAALGSRIRSMSLKQAIYTIVETYGGEDGIHVDEILEKLKEAGFPMKSQTPKASIASTIHLNTEANGTYERVGPNRFRLARAQEAAASQQSAGLEND